MPKEQIEEARRSTRATARHLKETEDAMDSLYDDLIKLDDAIESYNRTKSYCRDRLNDVLSKL